MKQVRRGLCLGVSDPGGGFRSACVGSRGGRGAFSAHKLTSQFSTAETSYAWLNAPPMHFSIAISFRKKQTIDIYGGYIEAALMI
jgi:hypothetical protein